MYWIARDGLICFFTTSTNVTTGLKLAPLISIKTVIKIIKMKIVASELIMSCTPISADKFVAIMPDPTTVATSNKVPKNSASKRLILTPNLSRSKMYWFTKMDSLPKTSNLMNSP